MFAHKRYHSATYKNPRLLSLPSLDTKFAMDDLTETMESARLEDGPREPEHLLFEPKEDSGLPQEALDRIPRYLFRVASPRSDGITGEKWVRSEAVKRNLPSSREDIFFNLDPSKKKTVAQTLNLHLRWWPKGELEDNFVSWTSSLLFAIQYIYYRHLHDKDRSSLEEIKLYVVDTTLFHRGTFLCDLDLIDVFRDFDDRPPRKGLVSRSAITAQETRLLLRRISLPGIPQNCKQMSSDYCRVAFRGQSTTPTTASVWEDCITGWRGRMGERSRSSSQSDLARAFLSHGIPTFVVI